MAGARAVIQDGVVYGDVYAPVYTHLEVVMALADLPITEYSPGRSTLPRLGHRQLRGQLGPILGQIHRVRGAVEVVNDGQREVVVLDHDLFTQLVDSHQDAAALRESLPLLIAAAAAGVAIPSQTLSRLGIELPADPEALKRFRSGYPVRFTHGEDGTRLAEATDVATDAITEAADEDELVLLDVDD
jgi:hypothetical protein